jgi:hypothetical protein
MITKKTPYNQQIITDLPEIVHFVYPNNNAMHDYIRNMYILCDET